MKAKNEITARMREAKKEAKRNNNKQVKQGLLSELIAHVKKKRKIGHHHIHIQAIKKRLYRHKDEILHHPGHKSPILSIEDAVVKLIIKISENCQCLTPSKDIALINSLILKQPIQKDLVEWKRKYSNNEDGSVGQSYWRAFLRRNCHRIVSK